MLKRIQKIVNIGRFADCQVPGCEFAKETVIFGYNTQGKSTLTAILRSIQTGNNDILIGRKTFGAADGSKIVEIDFDEADHNDRYSFTRRRWNKTNSNILIFDSRFIAENIFDGENINYSQQKKLNAVIIGEKGQDLNKEIINLQEQSENFKRQKNGKTSEFTRHFSNINLEKFRALTRSADIDDKLAEKEEEIKFENEREGIKNALQRHIKTISGFNFGIRNIFEKTLDAKQQDIEAHIKSNLAKKENAQNFLNEGLTLLKEKPSDNSPRTCVFCGQELTGQAESLISAYSAFFRGGYADLQDEVNETINYFRDLNIEASLQKIADDLKSRGLSVELTDSKIFELSELKKEFEKELYKKRDLNYVINFDTFDCLKIGVERIRDEVEELERKKFNNPSQKTLLELEQEKDVLLHVKKRYEPMWVSFFDELDNIENEVEKIRAEREIKRKELEVYSSAIFDMHKDTINRFCREMCADFEIEDFRPLKKIVGKDERIFAIKFFGAHKVYIGNDNDNTPSFKNTLSESDKRLLAFAFFLSLLAHDCELDKKIIVFDDPMSSFDSERRRRTVHLITDINYKFTEANGGKASLLPKQKIILTHEERFAKELCRSMTSACTLKIIEYVESDHEEKRSKISHADYFKEFPDDDISQRIEKVKEILDTLSFDQPFEQDCRIVLEHIFKRKYYLDLKDQIALNKSVRTFTTNLMQNNIGGFDDTEKSQKFLRLCGDLNIEMHDNNMKVSNGDKESILKDFFECLRTI